MFPHKCQDERWEFKWYSEHPGVKYWSVSKCTSNTKTKSKSLNQTLTFFIELCFSYRQDDLIYISSWRHRTILCISFQWVTFHNDPWFQCACAMYQTEDWRHFNRSSLNLHVTLACSFFIMFNYSSMISQCQIFEIKKEIYYKKILGHNHLIYNRFF